MRASSSDDTSEHEISSDGRLASLAHHMTKKLHYAALPEAYCDDETAYTVWP